MTDLGKMPAFPPASADQRDVLMAMGLSVNGMDLRTYIAVHAMQALLASGPHDCDEHGIAHDALLHADALIEALQEKQG